MANVTSCVVQNLDASGNDTPADVKSDIDNSGSNAYDGDHRRRRETFLRITVVAAMIAIVWSLIIVSVVSPYFPRGNKVHAKCRNASPSQSRCVATQLTLLILSRRQL